MLKNNYYNEIHPLLMKFFKNDIELLNKWLFCPNHVFNKFTPISLILTGDDLPLKWVTNQLKVKK